MEYFPVSTRHRGTFVTVYAKGKGLSIIKRGFFYDIEHFLNT